MDEVKLTGKGIVVFMIEGALLHSVPQDLVSLMVFLLVRLLRDAFLPA
ncbi:MAG: hypothetical protein KAG93_04810 [Desulfuromusa sp.]|nr:hypothetical protein [Desulfuromusa sp.]